MRTKIDIDALEAGPEMDDLVAERILGYQINRFDYRGPDSDTIEHCRTWVVPATEKHMNAIPYSTDRALFWQVVERLNELGMDVQLGSIVGAQNPWECTVYPSGWTSTLSANDVVAYERTAPLAVCKAALKAVWP